MTNAQKLEALVRRAVEGGWKLSLSISNAKYNWPPKKFKIEETYGDGGDSGYAIYLHEPHGGIEKLCDAWEAQDLIFDHDFARALFGEQGFPGEFTGRYPNPELPSSHGGAQRGWRHHLQQAVISDDPIDYMYKAVFGDA